MITHVSKKSVVNKVKEQVGVVKQNNGQRKAAYKTPSK
jgi:hypothetical protein